MCNMYNKIVESLAKKRATGSVLWLLDSRFRWASCWPPGVRFWQWCCVYRFRLPGVPWLGLCGSVGLSNSCNGVLNSDGIATRLGALNRRINAIKIPGNIPATNHSETFILGPTTQAAAQPRIKAITIGKRFIGCYPFHLLRLLPVRQQLTVCWLLV